MNMCLSLYFQCYPSNSYLGCVRSYTLPLVHYNLHVTPPPLPPKKEKEKKKRGAIYIQGTIEPALMIC